LDKSFFPWPQRENVNFPSAFVQCSGVESSGGSRSKANVEQVALVERILRLLKNSSNDLPTTRGTAQDSIAILTPYTAQIKLLKQKCGGMGAVISTIDGFQGKEADVVIFSTVRCQIRAKEERVLGFLDDKRRLNVAWTRARKGIILVGDRDTLEINELWKRALKATEEVELGEEML
ncbi:hypothetical protein BT69DRAFT_1194569, partial [Atractiella rhizophila]